MARPPVKQFDVMHDNRGSNPFQDSPRMRRKPPKQASFGATKPSRKISFKPNLNLNKLMQSKLLYLVLLLGIGAYIYLYRDALSTFIPNVNINIWLPIISLLIVAAVMFQHIRKTVIERKFRGNLKQLGFKSFFEYDNAVLIREMNLGRDACTKIQREVINRLNRQHPNHKNSLLEYEQTYAEVAHELGINGAIWDQSIHGQSQLDTLRFLDQSRNVSPPNGFIRYLAAAGCGLVCFIGLTYSSVSPYWFIPVALTAILLVRELLPGLMLVALSIIFTLLILDLSKVIVFT